MVVEVEAKYMVLCDLEVFLNKLSKLNPIYVGSRLEIDTYYNHPCRDFRATDEALRIRTIKSLSKGVTHVLTYKGKRLLDNMVKKREELELNISDPGILDEILIRLGFKKVARFSKKRIVYNVNNCMLSIDKLYGVGLFVEIEGSEDRIKEIHEFLSECLKPIGKTYLEICIETGRCIVVEE